MFYVVKDTIFWAVIPRSLVEIYGHFRPTCCLYLQCRYYLEDWGSKFFPTPSVNVNRLCEVTSQKTAFFIVAATEISKNLHVLPLWFLHSASQHRIEVAGLAH